ncbi:MAG: twin-arginine translocase subunit TatC [Deltaproteobacteria bacterium]|nr:twin-arginine translocase subunit TatC [Deltaproteobacteria bacterium]
MTLLEHLSELRRRLWWCVVSVCVTGGLSLWFARDLFGLLMRPVLAALPEDARALVYTSGIEEINVLLKVGMYAGVFLSAPVILFQLWRFVAPGLYQHERKLVLPFVSMGTLFFVGGAVFCYLAVLPTMFQFLLTEADEHEVHQRSVLARAQDADAARLLALGAKEPALALIGQARERLLSKGDGRVEEPDDSLLHPPSVEEVKTRDQLLSAQLEEALALAQRSGAPAQAALVSAINQRQEGAQKLNTRDASAAAKALDGSADQLANVYEAALGKGYGDAYKELWRLDRHLGMAVRREASIEWTRPMLTMSEQLSLVLLLEVAFGIIFELPLIMSLLAFLGLVNAKMLAKYQRHAILLCVVLAAVITPSGDAVNLALMAVPMIVCYELGVLGAWLVGRRKAQQQRPPPDLKVVG